MEQEGPNNLENSFADFIKSHRKYLNTCLLNIKENFEEKSKIYILNVHFFPHLHLDTLIELHTTLDTKLGELDSDRKKISIIFEKLEKKFLIYAKVLPKIDSLRVFLEERLKKNPEFKKELNDLTKDSKKTERNKDGDSLLELILKIPQHIMRYASPYLEEVVKQARENSVNDIEFEAKKAQDLMSNLVKHLNDFTDDYNNIIKVEDLEEAHDFSLRTFGRIHLDMPNVDAIIKSKESQKCKLYILSEALLLIKHEPNGKRPNSMFANGAQTNEERKSMVAGLFKLRDAYEIIGNKQELTIYLRSFDNKIRVHNDKDFKIKLSNENDYLNVLNNLKERDSRIQQLASIKPNSFHSKCIYKIFQNKITSDYQQEDHKKCFECKNYLGGKILVGVDCLTCGNIYHVECFQNENEESFQIFDFLSRDKLIKYNILLFMQFSHNLNAVFRM